MKKAVEGLAKVQIALGAIFLVIFLVVVVYQMFARFMGITATWTEEVSMYSFIWAIFMGSSAMVFEKRHFAFTSISDMLKNKKIKSIVSLLISLIMLYFTVLMIIYGQEVAKIFWNYTWTFFPGLKRGPVWLCIPIAGVTSSIYLIYHIIVDILSIVKKGE
ncbi:C4-dicarboxylate ABC transporter permease [Candidatus Epulonipiscium fishelsonii]|uniref:C4-dicarboxylate ABC transporter permease n=1 Tax=Candidatus Epulonipiscium fishelsonii TaxID=77094 RepID=A0ACC8X787_9FIRM|nr:C4-dicarboxylate ABC transporter permease [Epulopiscium sp. SCG-D08WGA-EpuloA1]OON90356.1 MAG: C4-dicarboxylate ABC transporter permease [Epulopiscium sp. AS2M-Bin002]